MLQTSHNAQEDSPTANTDPSQMPLVHGGVTAVDKEKRVVTVVPVSCCSAILRLEVLCAPGFSFLGLQSVRTAFLPRGRMTP